MNIRSARQLVVRLLYSNRITRSITRRIALDELCLRDILAHPIFATRLDHDPLIRSNFEKLHEQVNPNDAIIRRIKNFTLDEQRAIIKHLNLTLVVNSLSPDEILEALPRATLEKIAKSANADGAPSPNDAQQSPVSAARTRRHAIPGPFSETRHALYAAADTMDIVRSWCEQIPIDATVILLRSTDATRSIDNDLKSTRQVKQVIPVSPNLESGGQDAKLQATLNALDIVDVVTTTPDPQVIRGLYASGLRNILVFDGHEVRQLDVGNRVDFSSDDDLRFRPYALA